MYRSANKRLKGKGKTEARAAKGIPSGCDGFLLFLPFYLCLSDRVRAYDPCN